MNAQSQTHETKRNYSVLFLCTDNSVSSIMAEAILRRWGGESFRAFSAGITPSNQIQPLAAELLKTRHVWHPDLRCKGCYEFLAPDAPRMDFVISVGEQRPEELPPFPGQPRVFHWHISDPRLGGRPAENNASLRRTFGELENRIRLFVLVHQKEKTRRSAA